MKKSVWIVGGDGWAYDIGYGGLDHVLASGANVNVLVLDTEVYSNTGGQQSKATPTARRREVRVGRKSRREEGSRPDGDAYGHVYVAQVAMGAKDAQTLKAFLEAESYDGPSLIIAYSHCIAHGYDMAHGLEHQKLAVESGYWPLYRFDPRRAARGEQPFTLDSAHPKADVSRLLARSLASRLPSSTIRALSCAFRRGAAADCAAHRALRGDGETLMELTTRYLGLLLAQPFMPGASPLTDTLDSVRGLEDAGASAIVMHSLFEEEIVEDGWAVELRMGRTLSGAAEAD